MICALNSSTYFTWSLIFLCVGVSFCAVCGGLMMSVMNSIRSLTSINPKAASELPVTCLLRREKCRHRCAVFLQQHLQCECRLFVQSYMSRASIHFVATSVLGENKIKNAFMASEALANDMGGLGAIPVHRLPQHICWIQSWAEELKDLRLPSV